MGVTRSRRPAALVVLAVMLVGVAASAAAALASGDCCAGMPMSDRAGEPAAPCHSVAPTSCCEEVASARLPLPQGAPALAAVCQGLAQPADRIAVRSALGATRSSPTALTAVVLRL